MKNFTKSIGLAAVAAILLTGCSVSKTRDEPVEESTAGVVQTKDRTEVEWADYDASVKTTIDELETAKDCAGLQSQFDIADANSEATMNRAGHSNAKLMAYIDEGLKAAGCY